MGDILLFNGPHGDARPWYTHPDLQADVEGFVFARFLPQDTYVPHEYVLACITTSVWWHKTLNVSWMQMDLDPLQGIEVPFQHHRKGAVVMYVDDDQMAFGVASPDDLTEPVRIQADCVTDIHLCDVVPEPVKCTVDPADPYAEHHEKEWAHPLTECPRCDRSRADKYVADLLERYKHIQVDG